MRRRSVLIRRYSEVGRIAERTAGCKCGRVRKQRKAAGLEIGRENIGPAVAVEIGDDRRERPAFDGQILPGVETAVARTLKNREQATVQRDHKIEDAVPI